MAESSRKRKSVPKHRQHGMSSRTTAPPNPTTAPNRSLSLFSTSAQRERYHSSFSNRDILDPKFLDSEFFEGENFDCYEVFKNYELLDFMSLKLPHYPELVRVFYSNLEIRDGVIHSEVYKIPIVIDQSLFYSLTKLKSQGVPFEGNVVDDWKFDYSTHAARQMISVDNADMSGRLLAGTMKFDYRIMHYIICRVLLPRSSNLAQATEEDIILMWALLTGRQLDWAHLVRHRMNKALRANSSLPYPHLITLFLQHFHVPLNDEPHVIVKRSFAIGAGAISSFGYKKDRNNQWIRKKDDQAEAHDDRTPSPPPQDPSSDLLTIVLNEMRDLRAFVGERFDSVDTRLTRLESDMDSLRRHFDPSADS